ncbi:ABC transporter ATP-binding protein [Proteiniclasticum sp. QWL-01]|uniref:ABC transporter ATP-binding protein n=1 Tax=Proteiniclasticum sp. QWL-01 TaxID=3036945 RepID=UPI00240EC414|nr:ABC transporter ATP-binding protein [Proteiniclasticum sp. QWL-01]WFF73043.1 ABC transporter ATP-binding protein [Proteiniclasticum sp. QWL-01]
MSIVFTNYTKKIKNNLVLNNINLEIQSGTVVGLLGKNGSGKTMLLRSVAGLILPTSGSIAINGELINSKNRFPESVGVIIENMDFWPHLTALETLEYINSFTNKTTKEKCITWLKDVGLDPNSKKTVRSFSLGMKQKLALAQAFFRDPDILLLDEPTSALDIESTKSIYEIFEAQKQRGKTMIIASHAPEDLEICDMIIKIDNGAIIAITDCGLPSRD